ncbi:hypothetical protein ACWDA9_24775, partial [Streptomyces sp. NPDC001193]
RQVYCFENRGTEIGVTLAHPHGGVRRGAQAVSAMSA